MGERGGGRERERCTSVEKIAEVKCRGQNKKSVSIPDRLILTQLILRIKKYTARPRWDLK
jgi:hypothetical protein